MIHCVMLQIPGQDFPFLLLFVFFNLKFYFVLFRGGEVVGAEGGCKGSGDGWDLDACGKKKRKF